MKSFEQFLKEMMSAGVSWSLQPQDWGGAGGGMGGSSRAARRLRVEAVARHEDEQPLPRRLARELQEHLEVGQSVELAGEASLLCGQCGGGGGGVGGGGGAYRMSCVPRR